MLQVLALSAAGISCLTIIYLCMASEFIGLRVLLSLFGHFMLALQIDRKYNFGKKQFYSAGNHSVGCARAAWSLLVWSVVVCMH